RALAEMLVHPPHVVQNLAEHLVSTPRQLQFEDHESASLIHSQDVDPAVLHWELDALLLVLLEKSEPWFHTSQVVRQEVSKVGLCSEGLLFLFLLRFCGGLAKASEEVLIAAFEPQPESSLPLS